MPEAAEFALHVSSKDLAKALRQIARFKKSAGKGQMMLVSFDGEALTFSMSDVSIGVLAEGTWPGDVIVPALSIYGLARVPPRTPTVAITLKDDRLKIGTTVMHVTWGAMPTNADGAAG